MTVTSPKPPDLSLDLNRFLALPETQPPREYFDRVITTKPMPQELVLDQVFGWLRLP